MRQSLHRALNFKPPPCWTSARWPHWCCWPRSRPGPGRRAGTPADRRPWATDDDIAPRLTGAPCGTDQGADPGRLRRSCSKRRSRTTWFLLRYWRILVTRAAPGPNSSKAAGRLTPRPLRAALHSTKWRRRCSVLSGNRAATAGEGPAISGEASRDPVPIDGHARRRVSPNI